MLRPKLLAALRAKSSWLGSPVIACEHEEMSSTYTNRVGGGKELTVIEGGEYYRVNCPHCGDTRRRLWINYRWGLYDPTTKSLNLFLAVCYNEGCFSEPGRARDLYNELFSDFSHEGNDSLRDGIDPKEEPVKAEWPGDLRAVNTLPLDHPAAKYLREKGYDLDYLTNVFKVSFCLGAEPKFRAAQGRIVIPIFNDGELKGWQARYVGKPPDKYISKYYNMVGMKRNRLLYNLDVARKYPYVVICEGPKDVWSYGPEAVGLFGKSISTLQLSKITGIWKKVYIALDGDAPIDAQGIYDALGPNVDRYIVTLPGKLSPGDLATPRLRHLVLSTPSTASITQ